jgi:hypothetical protein
MTVHINRPSSTMFYAQGRGRGIQKWGNLAGPFVDIGEASRFAASTLVAGFYHKTRVIMTADWYDPSVMIEMKR